MNRAHWPTKGNRQKLTMFGTFPVHGKKIPEMAPNGARRIFVPTNPDLAVILGDTDFDFENDDLWDFFGFQFSRFPDPENMFLLGSFRPPDPLLFQGGFQPPRPLGGGPAAPRAPLLNF